MILGKVSQQRTYDKWLSMILFLMVFDDIELLFFSIYGTIRALGPDWAWFTFWGRISSVPRGRILHSANAPNVEDEFEAKQKELEGIVNPIMMKVYQTEVDVSWI